MANNNYNLWHEFKKGLWQELPPFRLILGMCPTLAVTNSVINGVAMGLATSFVLLSANISVSLIRKIVPSQVRIATYVVVIALYVTVADLFLAAMFPPISKALGPYVPLIVVNCIILGRAEGFAQKNPLTPSIMDALGIGLGFTLSLALMGGIREIFGFGSILDIKLLGEWFEPWIVMILPAGAFFVFGFLVALTNYLSKRKAAAPSGH
ncbi:MAG: electron transport complex subunit RsxE [Deltaproteobacteria bacterium GWC2_42_51]|nr:MAG: electron transport complex subunit RsxE [Deltaproteobacteria bacterium GWA2_42_85]OGP30696.1 MAG: electron transport complex subunit RsxE [Deltaproteobacteria bacterium GWB2_42_7]OGP35276.1 MAG: electron transport complex subunit RsxE [Deltaproteobacteria bacterium GWC2_42_51]OGP42394.1 MAG: electron transport complex subunit RsxE [Deltaproteobacteria bacterium GWD2_42_10]OGP45701.1 MAG: electron transport complex subunit RsxE [Deltaproteobacteria bacterium GWF2_42_12]OGQ26522.1 MAG: e